MEANSSFLPWAKLNTVVKQKILSRGEILWKVCRAKCRNFSIQVLLNFPLEISATLVPAAEQAVFPGETARRVCTLSPLKVC